jgi:hypothetical protein
MKKSNLLKYIFFIAITLIANTGYAQKTAVEAYQTTETVVLASEGDGSITLRVWGSGRNRIDAIEQAKKNAVRETIFIGFRTNNTMTYTLHPLINEPNAEEIYEEYFNLFFSDKGEYSKYVSTIDQRTNSKVKEKSKVERKYGITVRVLRPELKLRLIKDGILKK